MVVVGGICRPPDHHIFYNINLYNGGKMSEEKMVHLHAMTNCEGSECSDEICTVAEWKKMTAQERTDICLEFQENVVNIWVVVEGEE